VTRKGVKVKVNKKSILNSWGDHVNQLEFYSLLHKNETLSIFSHSAHITLIHHGINWDHACASMCACVSVCVYFLFCNNTLKTWNCLRYQSLKYCYKILSKMTKNECNTTHIVNLENICWFSKWSCQVQEHYYQH